MYDESKLFDMLELSIISNIITIIISVFIANVVILIIVAVVSHIIIVDWEQKRLSVT